MSNIIGQVGRRSFKVKLLNISIHMILLVGAATMIYPFLIMLSGSLKSDLDNKYFTILPRYFYDDVVLYQKYLFSKYNGQTFLIKRNLKENCASVEKIKPPEFYSPKLVTDFAEFLEKSDLKLNSFFYGQGMVYENGIYPLLLRCFRSWLQEQYSSGEKGLFALNRDLGTELSSWEEVMCPKEDFFARRNTGNYSGFLSKFREFKEKRSGILSRYYFALDGYFMEILLRDVATDLTGINRALGTDYKNFQQIVVPDIYPADRPELARVWENFVRKELNLQFIKVGGKALYSYHNFLRGRYENRIVSLNKAWGTNYKVFKDIPLVKEVPASGVLLVDWNDFISEKAPIEAISILGLGHYYRDFLKRRYGTVTKLNAVYGRGFEVFAAVPLPETFPEDNIALQKDWEAFLAVLPFDKIGLKRSSIFEYRKFISDIYLEGKAVNYARISRDYGLQIDKANDIPAFQDYPQKATKKAKNDYVAAVKSEKFAEMRILKKSPKVLHQWREFLNKRYNGKIEKLNVAYGLLYTSFATVPISMNEWEWYVMNQHKSKIFREFLWRNYAMVFDTVFFNGYAAMNTVIYCVLAILAALIVNPLAAYALSRYNPPSTYKILLLLMLTMAFPPMVLGIPNFLMIKNLGLLNTFAALILPGMASGYSIFLLKGFFDSLPKELFECATLDGASEWTMFWRIAMTLSKPILAVIALQTFMAAYGNFMMAFLTCQNPKMWTLMVYLYQLQQHAGQAVGFASLVVAAIPTFLVFLFCQNMIIRGIVVPTEK